VVFINEIVSFVSVTVNVFTGVHTCW